MITLWPHLAGFSAVGLPRNREDVLSPLGQLMLDYLGAPPRYLLSASGRWHHWTGDVEVLYMSPPVLVVACGTMYCQNVVATREEPLIVGDVRLCRNCERKQAEHGTTRAAVDYEREDAIARLARVSSEQQPRSLLFGIAFGEEP